MSKVKTGYRIDSNSLFVAAQGLYSQLLELGGDVLHGLHGVLCGDETSSHNVLNLRSTKVSFCSRVYQFNGHKTSLTHFHKLEEASVDALALSGGQI